MSQNRWKVGSLFQQAVAGVESRLDQMLAEEEDAKRQQAKPAPAHSRSNSLSSSMLIDSNQVYETLSLTMSRRFPQFVERKEERSAPRTSSSCDGKVQ
jgi:hypothetical protein